MGIGEQVHWHEGLFLQPHHLQVMQRRLVEQIASACALTSPYSYGVITAVPSPKAIENRQVRFDRLHLVLRSGLEIDIPGNTDLPALELDRAFDNAKGPIRISIGVPNWYSARANSMDLAEKQDAKIKRLYKTAEVNIADENTGLNPQPIQIRRINARLLLDDDDRDDMEVMPLFHVSTPAMGAIGLPRIDPISFPPCLFLSAWEPLHSLIRAMVDEIEATRGGVAKDLLRDGFDIQSLRPAQMRQVLRLQALNRAASRLPSLVRAPRITPFQLYLELRELLGNLAISDPDGDAFECADYDHDDPALPFKDVCDRIRKYLDRQAGPSALKWELVRENRAFVGRGIPKENLELPELFLAIETHEDRAKVAQLVQDSIRFKMLPASLVNKIAQKGVRLVLDHNPPSNLPSAPGRSYFRIMRDDETSEGWWEKIKAEGAVGVTWLGMDLPDVRFTLHAMLKH